MRYFAPLLILFLLGVAAAPEPVSAQPYGPPPPYGPRARVQSGEVRSLGEILDSVRRQRPGNFVDVQGPNIGPSGDPRYRLKWVSPDGRVEWLDTDARTGRILGAQGPDRGPRVVVPNGGPNGGGPRGIGPRRQNFVPGPVMGPRPGFIGRPGPRPLYGARPGFRGRGPVMPGISNRFRPGGPGPRFRGR